MTSCGVGFMTVVSVGRLPAAVELAKRARRDGAVLDIDRNAMPIGELADALARGGALLLFAAGRPA